MEDRTQLDLPVQLNGQDANPEEQERHTGEIQDIITKVPSWVIRWGILVFFCVLLIVTAIAAIVRYPDTVKAHIRFQPIERDYDINAPAEAVVKQVFVSHDIPVKPGQLLTVINAGGKDINLNSPVAGKVGFSAILEPGMRTQLQQPLIVIHPLTQHFFGVMQIPVTTVGQLKVGQKVIVSLTDQPNQKDDQINGAINALTDEPDKNGMITAKITIDGSRHELKTWMTGNAEILTKDISVGERIWNSVVKKL